MMFGSFRDRNHATWIPVFQAEKDYFLVTIEEADGPPKLVVLAKKKTTASS